MMFFRQLVVFLLLPLITFCTKLQEEQISRWAEKIGDDLWRLGEVTTKFKEIQGSYLFFNAQVEKKDLEDLIVEVGDDIERMMDRKSDAIKCISERAESASENFLFQTSKSYYYSSKYSNVEHEPPIQLPKILEVSKDMYLNLSLNNDTHFYNLLVDTARSSVHVPTNIFDRHDDPAFAIQWSEELNEVFVQNYNSDPALSWQYFCSMTGVMRHYPATKWPEIAKDEFDCRVRTWYIEAATCTKDVIILLDNSGSMDGMGKHIASLTVNTILDTFSNNDYINILYYSNETTNYTIPCFKGLLVQATPENVNLFKEEISNLGPSGKTDLPQALQSAFEILEEYRIRRGCNNVTVDEDGKSKTCNQAIMLVTDGILKNLSDVVIRNNHFDKGNIPVRIFTYLIGKEATNVDEIHWMSCANRGFYTQVQTLEQVTSSVLQYINVIARPLVLQAEDHPISWTHAYMDTTYDEEKDNHIRLLTSAAVPAFDRKNNQNNATRVANLLGVAGTDVPIDDIEKLTLPYKLGVNAYAFIVSNNGYVLMHRDFRPMYFYKKFKGHLRRNYNSIDLVEIEQFGEELPPRIIPEKLKDLRNRIVSGEQGNMLGIPINYHYDDMRRVTKDNYDYYFVPLNQTPFSLAFAVPDGYGHFSLHVEDEIKNDRHKPGVKITDYFAGSNWKIHPKWVYCKYHYLEGHEFATPEMEILHFLDKVNEDDFIWEKQYEGGISEELTKVDCGRKTHGDDDYYCDEHLVQRLVFDAKNTFAAFQGTSLKETAIWFEAYNATLRFVATMSGLTRWEYISEEVEKNSKKHEFGDLHSRAIDETWYKSAVIQHRYDPESFVFSVPFDVADKGLMNGLLITASYAVFPTDAEANAPGSVVGYQFAHKNFVDIVKKITAALARECTNCGTCDSNLSCYIIDSDGYVIVSISDDSQNDVGLFFGEVEPDIMDSMVKNDPVIFEKIKIYDYQAVCSIMEDGSSDATILSTPINFIKTLMQWFMLKLAWFAVEMNFWSPLYVFADSDEEPKKKIFVTYYDCEQYRYLYMLQQKIFIHNNFPGQFEGSKTYYLKKVPHSNLLFVAINTTMPRPKSDSFEKHSTRPKRINYNDTFSYLCQKLDLNNLPRRRLAGCYNEDPLEKEITACGRSTTIKASFVIVIVALLCFY